MSVIIRFLDEYAQLVRDTGIYVEESQLNMPITEDSGMDTPEEHIAKLYESEGLKELA